MLKEAGQFLWKNMVWDSEASLASNLAWGALMVGSLAAAPFSGGSSVAGAVAARTAARAGIRTALKSAAKSATKVASKVAAGSADDVAKATAKATAKTTAHTADDAAKAAAKATSESLSQKAALSFTDKMALKSAKIGMLSTAGIATAIATEYATDGAVSEISAHTMLKVVDAVREIDPELAEQIKDGGMKALALAIGLAETPKNAAVNATSTILNEEGHTDAANGLKVLNTIASPSFYADIIVAEKDERANLFITKLSDAAGIEKDQVGHFLQSHPDLRNRAEDILDIDISKHFPELSTMEVANQSQQQTFRQEKAEPQNAWQTFLGADISQMGRGLLSTTFDNVNDYVSEHGGMGLKFKFFMASIVTGFMSMLSDLPIIGKWAQEFGDDYKRELLQDTRNRLQDMANGDVVGQGSNLMGMVRDMTGFGPEERPKGPAVQHQPELSM